MHQRWSVFTAGNVYKARYFDISQKCIFNVFGPPLRFGAMCPCRLSSYVCNACIVAKRQVSPENFYTRLGPRGNRPTTLGNNKTYGDRQRWKFDIMNEYSCKYIVCTVFQKSIPDIFDCNLKTNCQMLIIFGSSISDTICYQMIIQLSTSPNFCFCTTWGNTTSEISLFYPMQYDCLNSITLRNTFCLHFWHLGWHFIQLSIFQLPAVKLLEMLAHYANTGEETFSQFIDSSIAVSYTHLTLPTILRV